MKKILFMIAIVFSTGASAQNMQYDTCQYLNQYEGEWVYSNGPDTIKIYLRPNRTTHDNFMSDALWGWIYYRQGNVILMTDYERRNMIFTNSFTEMIDSTSIQLNFIGDCTIDNKNLIGWSIDHLNAREIKIVSAVLNNTRTQMTWTVRDADGYGVFSGAYGRTLPRVFTLTKQ